MKAFDKSRLLNALIGLVSLLMLPLAVASDGDFPRTVTLGQSQDQGLGQVTIYSPQADEMTEDSLRFRSAMSWRETPDSDPIFGVGWFQSKVDIDRSKGRVRPYQVKLIESRFPEGVPDIDAALSRALSERGGSSNFEFALADLEASLEMARAEARSVEKLNTAPPDIIYRDRPALLVTLDGEPVLREIENSPYTAVINTPYPLISDGRDFYLNAAKDVWYRAEEATGPYRYDDQPPQDIVAMVNPDNESAASQAPAEKVTASNAPEIVVSTRPAELIVTEGSAAFVPLVDDLLVLKNSDNDVFMDVNSQDYFIVLSGRWYRSKSLNGPWSFEQADRLPPAFANIPQASDQADSRVYVAGTPEAREAVLDAQVPQTAAVERGEVDVDVRYDGDPQFAPVDGTQDMVYATNTGSTVVYSNRIYYLVEDGVWYESATPNGPWEVSVQRPQQVVYIEPTSPVYNVKYVRIYDYTPQVVYVGYTPGYVGSYVYHNTLFYGSGWYHRPWVSPHYYYPRHSTWGFNVSYNSWSGWGFGLSWGWGPFSFGYYSGGYWHHHHHWHHRHHGYWGPHGYRPRPVPYHHGRGHGYGNGHGQYAHRGNRHDNLYRDQRQPARVVNTRDNPPRSGGPGRGRGSQSPTLADTPLYAMNDRTTKQLYKRGESKGANGAKISQADLRNKASLRDRPIKQPIAKVSQAELREKASGRDRRVKQPDVKAKPVATRTAKYTPLPKSSSRSRKPLSSEQLRNVQVAKTSSRKAPDSAKPSVRPSVSPRSDASKGIPMPKSLSRGQKPITNTQLRKAQVTRAPSRTVNATRTVKAPQAMKAPRAAKMPQATKSQRAAPVRAAPARPKAISNSAPTSRKSVSRSSSSKSGGGRPKVKRD